MTGSYLVISYIAGAGITPVTVLSVQQRLVLFELLDTKICL